jgi:hypothetical protein
MINLCAPALIYVAFSLTQIIIDTFKGLYNTAFFKFIVMVIITILLNALCQTGMGIISWIIVFIPFIFMSVIVAILLFVFGLDPATGKLNFKCENGNTNTKGGNLIYSSTNTKPQTNQKYIDVTYSETPSNPSNEDDTQPIAPMYSSDPQFN